MLQRWLQPTTAGVYRPCARECGPWGYCDASIGVCICAIGRGGDDCRTLTLHHCRVHAEGEMACMTFRGLMSCECRRACEGKYGGVSRRHAPICWDFATPAKALAHNTSDLPELPMTALTFRTPAWPPIGRCARPNPPKHCASSQEKPLRRATAILGGAPVPIKRCPLACSRRGTCIRPFKDRGQQAEERFPLGRAAVAAVDGGAEATGGRRPACVCHLGYSGAGCELSDSSFCFNRCSGHGACVGRFCLCERGWQGIDCSLHPPGWLGAEGSPAAERAHALAEREQREGPDGVAEWMARQAEGGVRYTAADAKRAAAGGGTWRGGVTSSVGARPTPYAPIYVYPLPTAFSMEGVYQRDMHRRGQYYANLMYVEQLLARRDAVVSDPEAAALFFVPVMVMQMAGNLWHPYEFLKQTVHHLSHAYPYWNRSAGTDHVFFLTTDRGGCWKPWALQHSIIITYLGFRASEGYFGFEERLKWPPQGPNDRNNAYSVKRGSEALGLDCYVPNKDVAVPVDAAIGGAEEAKLPLVGTPFECKRGPHKVLLFMGGSMTNMGRVEYSQGVRQAIQRLHINETQFVLGGRFTLDELRASRFCLCPSGWGWGWRLSLAIVSQCVPVIIQPNVTQPFEDLLEGTPYSYDTFAIRLTKDDIPKLPSLLRAVPIERICAMQAMLARVYRAFLWQQPHGPLLPSAYDLTSVLLCRRAKELARRYALRGEHPQAWLARNTLRCADSLEAAGIRFD